MPFTASHLNELPVRGEDRGRHVYDVELPYRRLGRCRMCEAVAGVIGTDRADVALALSTYKARNGRQRTASELLGPGVDLGAEDSPTGGVSGSPPLTADASARRLRLLGDHTRRVGVREAEAPVAVLEDLLEATPPDRGAGSLHV